jgi:hypothetical protein
MVSIHIISSNGKTIFGSIITVSGKRNSLKSTVKIGI